MTRNVVSSLAGAALFVFLWWVVAATLEVVWPPSPSSRLRSCCWLANTDDVAVDG
jgi:hypothetical protein